MKRPGRSSRSVALLLWGAAVGAIADGGEGALVGSAVGAVAGTAVAAASGGKQVKIAAQTLLEFKLDKPVTIEVGTRLADD